MDMYKFMRPKEMFKVIDITPLDFVHNNKYQKDREARIVSVFGMGWELIEKKQCLVRLVENQEPVEAQIKIDDKEYGIQVTMCVDSERYIQNKNARKPFHVESQSASVLSLYSSIVELIKKKLKKYGTGSRINLLLYVNRNHQGINPLELSTEISKVENLNFESVWAIFDDYKPIDKSSVMMGFAVARLHPEQCKGFFTFSKDGNVW